MHKNKRFGIPSALWFSAATLSALLLVGGPLSAGTTVGGNSLNVTDMNNLFGSVSPAGSSAPIATPASSGTSFSVPEGDTSTGNTRKMAKAVRSLTSGGTDGGPTTANYKVPSNVTSATTTYAVESSDTGSDQNNGQPKPLAQAPRITDNKTQSFSEPSTLSSDNTGSDEGPGEPAGSVDEVTGSRDGGSGDEPVDTYVDPTIPVTYGIVERRPDYRFRAGSLVFEQTGTYTMRQKALGIGPAATGRVTRYVPVGEF